MRSKVLLILLIFSTASIEEKRIEYIQITENLPEVKLKHYEPKTHDEFLNDIGFRESSNRYHVTNKYGYMGRYQFGMSSLKTIGIKTTREEFLSNPRIQEKAMLRNLKRNKRILKTYIDQYDGTFVDSIYVTESGILAAAHLGGEGNVKKFFEQKYIKQDRNGTKITEYLDEFSGYELKLN